MSNRHNIKFVPKSLEPTPKHITPRPNIYRKLIGEFQNDLDDLSPDIPYSYEPLKKLREKWEKR